MNEQRLSSLLRRAGDRVPVGTPPVQQMIGEAGRRRRRRSLIAILGSAAAVAAVLGSVALLAPPHLGSDPQPPEPSRAVSPSTSSEAVTPPGTRLVGLGHAAIAVPADWATNAIHCGEEPTKNTVVIDVVALKACAAPRPKGVESVILSHGTRFDFHADRSIKIDGVPAERQDATCRDGFGGVTVCAGTVHIPSLQATFRAESSTSAAEVDRILEWIRIVRTESAVPGFQASNRRNAHEKYAEALQEVGLVARVKTKKVPAMPAGYILDVSPTPGTMAKPGEEVVVTAVAEPEGPADEIRIGMAARDDRRDEFGALTDEQIRSGGTIEVGVGDHIWVYAQGKRTGTLAGTLDGTSLAVDPWRGPNYPHAWKAVAPGHTKVTLTITADGQRIVLGTVTIVVE